MIPFAVTKSVMRSVSSMEAKRIPLGQKVAFGVGMLANQMFPAALGIFMVILVQSLGMSPFLWGLIFFLPKLVDCVTDPIMGFISDRTVSRWGKRRPYVFIGAFSPGCPTWRCGNSPQKQPVIQFRLFLVLVQRLFYRTDHIQCALRRHGLRDERRLPRAHATHGSGAVDWAMGLGYCSLVLDHSLRSQLV